MENHFESDLNSITIQLFTFLEEYYLLLKSEKYPALRRLYNKHLYLRDCQNTFLLNNEIKKGIIREINEEGKLIIQHDGGGKPYNFNEVKYL